jgi:hypothetical protein
VDEPRRQLLAGAALAGESTVAEVGAAWRSVSRTARKAGASPMSPPGAPESSASWARARGSRRTSEARSIACRTDFTMACRFTGFVMKSYAPSFIAATAFSTVP